MLRKLYEIYSGYIRKKKSFGKIKVGMQWHVEKWSNDQLVEKTTGHNLMTTEGLTYLAEIFNGGTVAPELRIAIFENDFTEAADATYATPGTMTECEAISQVARPIYTATQTSGVLSSENNKANFDFTAAKTIYGCSLVNYNGTEGTGAITAFADYSATQAGTVLVTSSGHGVTNNDIVIISGTTSYNGTFEVMYVTDNTFYITTTWVPGDTTGAFTHKPVAKLGDTAAGAGANLINVFNFGSGNEKSMDIGESLKIWGTFTFTDAG